MELNKKDDKEEEALSSTKKKGEIYQICNTLIFGSAFYCSDDQCLSGQIECLELHLNVSKET